MPNAGVMPFAGWNGFLGTRASLMLDVVFVAMLVVVPVLGASVYLVKFRRRYALHRMIQLSLGAVLAVTIVLFEVDIRVNGWMDRARPSPYFGNGERPGLVLIALWIHLFFAVTTLVLWTGVTIAALKQFSQPPLPGPHSRCHTFWGKLAAIDMLLTALTGWSFYWLAFVAQE